jgi:hypothetical protein
MGKGLSRNQERALEAIIQTPTIADAARVCGMGERTLWRYLKDEAFSEALKARQDEVIRTTTAAMVGLSSKAVEALAAILDDPKAPVSVKARVALGWLRQVRETVEWRDLIERVAMLEGEGNETNH